MALYEKIGSIYDVIDRDRKTPGGLPYVGDVSIPKKPYELVSSSNQYNFFPASVTYSARVHYFRRTSPLYQ